MACASHASKILHSFSEKVTKLKTELVSVVAASLSLFVFACDVFFCVACEALVITMWNVEIEPVDKRSS